MVGSGVIVNAFIVVVAGGMGKFRGAALVALLLGEVESVGSIWFRPVEVQVFALALVIAILVYRSRGKTAPLFKPSTVRARTSVGVQRATYSTLTVALLLVAVVAPPFARDLSQRIGIYLISALV